MRQWSALEGVVRHAAGIDGILGVLLVGSFAAGTTDALSDLDVILPCAEGSFERVWARREELEGGRALVAWDHVRDDQPERAVHKWLTEDLVFVECLIGTETRIRLAEPFVALVGGERAVERVQRRPTISRAEMSEPPNPVERAYDVLKQAARAARS